MKRRRPPARAILEAPPNLRERRRADGSLRVWWEPRADARALGFAVVELPADRPDFARAEAARLNAAVARAQAAGSRANARARAARTMLDLIVDYRQSVHFRGKLAPKTRNSYDKLLGLIEAKWGARRVADFDKPAMHTWYQTLHGAKGARTAQALIRMMSTLFGHAELIGWRAENSNPCRGLRTYTPAPRSRVATWAELDALLEAADRLGLASVAAAIALSLYTGQRQTDVLAARREAFRLVQLRPPGARKPRPVWVWTFTRSKRGNAGAVILHEDLVPRVRAILADAGTAAAPRQGTDPLLTDPATGKGYDEFLFSRRFAAIRAEAAKAVPSCASLQFRDLRRTAGVFARAGGASKDDVGDLLGNTAATDPALAETYMPPTLETASRAAARVRRPKGGL